MWPLIQPYLIQINVQISTTNRWYFISRRNDVFALLICHDSFFHRNQSTIFIHEVYCCQSYNQLNIELHENLCLQRVCVTISIDKFCFYLQNQILLYDIKWIEAKQRFLSSLKHYNEYCIFEYYTFIFETFYVSQMQKDSQSNDPIKLTIFLPSIFEINPTLYIIICKYNCRVQQRVEKTKISKRRIFVLLFSERGNNETLHQQ